MLAFTADHNQILRWLSYTCPWTYYHNYINNAITDSSGNQPLLETTHRSPFLTRVHAVLCRLEGVHILTLQHRKSLRLLHPPTDFAAYYASEELNS